VKEEIANLRAAVEDHKPLGESLLSGRYQFKADLLAIAILDRSLSMLRGFCDLVEVRNMVAAAPLLRCQLDSGLRFFAATLVDDPHEFAWKIRNGTEVRSIKDKDGKKMTDAYLVQKAAAHWPWVPSIYKQACGYVHLSEKHLFNTIPPAQNDTGLTTIKISGYDGPGWSEELYLEAIEAFDEITSMVLGLVAGWAQLRVEKLHNVPPHVIEQFEAAARSK
jgi:hypothetical protein